MELSIINKWLYREQRYDSTIFSPNKLFSLRVGYAETGGGSSCLGTMFNKQEEEPRASLSHTCLQTFQKITIKFNCDRRTSAVPASGEGAQRLPLVRERSACLW